MKPYVRKFSENTGILPEGFQETYTGGNIVNYTKALSNGLFVALSGGDNGELEQGEQNTASLFESPEAYEDGSTREVKYFTNRAELDAILSQWEKGQIEHVTVICEEDNYQRKLLVEYGDYTGRVVEGPDGVNLVVDWDETPENWEDIDEAIAHSNIMNLEDGQVEEIPV